MTNNKKERMQQQICCPNCSHVFSLSNAKPVPFSNSTFVNKYKTMMGSLAELLRHRKTENEFILNSQLVFSWSFEEVYFITTQEYVNSFEEFKDFKFEFELKESTTKVEYLVISCNREKKCVRAILKHK